jgi:dihydrolipoamide dehydrogenase
MGLENIGVQLNERRGIKVDRNLQTTVKGVYAAGDCIGDRQL